MHSISNATAAVSRGGENGPRVHLSGSLVNFSSRILALLRREFPEFDFLWINGANLASISLPGSSHLIIVDESMVAKAQELLDQGQTNVVIAFNDAHSFGLRLDALGLRTVPPGLSLLPMNVRLDVWLSIVQLLLCGETYVPTSMLRPHDAAGSTRPAPSHQVFASEADGGAVATMQSWEDPAMRTLTDRERKVLPLIAKGRQNKVIASELNISEHTVKLHVHHIIGKLVVRNRTEAAGLYLSQSTIQGTA